MKKSSDLAIERASQMKATAMLAAMKHPVYFVPGTAPARAPAIIARAWCGVALAFEMTSTPTVAKKAIQRSGAPDVEICQNTTGVSTKTSAVVQAQRPSAHSRARQAAAAAAKTPPRNKKPMASWLLPSASPARTKRGVCPEKKWCKRKKSGGNPN